MTRGDILVLDARESQVPRADGGSGCGMVKLLYLTHFGDGRLSPIVWMSVVFLDVGFDAFPMDSTKNTMMGISCKIDCDFCLLRF